MTSHDSEIESLRYACWQATQRGLRAKADYLKRRLSGLVERGDDIAACAWVIATFRVIGHPDLRMEMPLRCERSGGRRVTLYRSDTAIGSLYQNAPSIWEGALLGLRWIAEAGYLEGTINA